MHKHTDEKKTPHLEYRFNKDLPFLGNSSDALRDILDYLLTPPTYCTEDPPKKAMRINKLHLIIIFEIILNGSI